METWIGKKHDKAMVQEIEQIEGNEGSYFYLYPFGDLV